MKIRSHTERDPVLSRVYHWVMHGWERHDSSDPDFKPQCKRKDELAAIDGILTWGMRVIVPPASRSEISKILHDTHIGISRMKALARSYVLWPGIDSPIEEGGENMCVLPITSACSLRSNIISLGVASKALVTSTH